MCEENKLSNAEKPLLGFLSSLWEIHSFVREGALILTTAIPVLKHLASGGRSAAGQTCGRE